MSRSKNVLSLVPLYAVSLAVGGLFLWAITNALLCKSSLPGL